MDEDVALAVVCHDDHYFLEAAISAMAPIKTTVFVSMVGWDKSGGEPQKCIDAVTRAGAEVITGSWDNEADHRRFALATMKERGVKWLFVLDGDELLDRRLRDELLALARTGVFDLFRVRMQTFFKSVRYRIHPPEELAPIVLIDAQNCEHLHIREYSGSRPVTLGFEHGVLNHLSWVGSDERIRRKLETSSHRAEFVPNYFEDVWLAWDRDRTLRNIHPTHPQCYGFADRIKVPEVLKGISDGRPALREPELPKNWLRISVVIALYGGPELIARCLESVQICGIIGWKPRTGGRKVKGNPDERPPLIYEVIVVDDLSPDEAAEVAARFPFVKLIRNKENLGFGASNNIGIQAATGDAVLLLNSDTRLPRAALLAMGRSLLASGTIGAVGPYTNNAGYKQGIVPTMSDLANLERFACDFSHREVPDEENTSMLVGFCLLVRKSVLDETGLFDLRFKRALFEDTDLVYRIQRAGYKIRISSTAYVHHEGSKSLARMDEHPSLMLARNKPVFEEKWQLDKATEFASHLAGERPGRIMFRPEREPRFLIEQLTHMAHKAGISVCIIARDEAKNIGRCLASLHGVFQEVIVMDTGSLDETREIAKSHGAKVYQMEWPESFSIARNMSISKANGRWILWVDADDEVPFATLEAIIYAALGAKPEVNGFVIPVQFVGSPVGEGTRVDHIKLFRNDPRHRFEGRIHEQILHSLRATGGQIERIPHCVLHVGYDSSPAGQLKKRKRDRRLLMLDLKDRPGHPFALFNLGMTQFYCGKHRAAIGWLRRCLRVSDPGDSHARKTYSLYGLALRELGRVEEAIDIFEQGLQAVGNDPELRFNLGASYGMLGRLPEARANYLAMPTDTSGQFSSLDIGILGHKRLNNLASVCFAMGLETEAKNHLREAIRINPYFTGSATALFEVAMKTGDVHAAREAADALSSVQGPSEQWANCRIGIAELVGVDPDQDLLNLVRGMPQAMGPGLVLNRRLMQRGQLDLSLMGHLEALGSSEAAFHLAGIERGRGDLEAAHYHARLSAQLAPESNDSASILQAIEVALDDRVPLPASVELTRESVLVGPHVGRLGPAELERSVIIVTFNSERIICQCVERALASLAENDELILVDNASTDGTAGILRDFEQRDPRVRLLLQTENHGYAEGCNIGMLASRGAHIVALNPDASIEPGWLEGLAAHLTGDVAAVGPSCDNVAGQQFVGNYLNGTRLAPEQIPAFMAELPKTSKRTKLLMGVCLMMRRDLLDRHGLLCEETSLGADDLEFSWRFRMLGYGLAVVPSVFVRHVGGASFATLPKLETRKKIRRSDRALVRRLRAYYGEAGVPSSFELFGCDIFAEALATAPVED